MPEKTTRRKQTLTQAQIKDRETRLEQGRKVRKANVMAKRNPPPPPVHKARVQAKNQPSKPTAKPKANTRSPKDVSRETVPSERKKGFMDGFFGG